MDLDRARAFIGDNPRAVLVTRKRGGDPQTSPVVVAIDADGHAVISTRETAYKAKNVQRDPKVTLCCFSEAFFGEWIQVDGSAEIISLPQAMDLLIDYYRRLSGEHPDWDDYRAAMERERRVLMRIAMDHAGPDRSC